MLPTPIERVVVLWHTENGRQVHREVPFDDAMLDRALREARDQWGWDDRDCLDAADEMRAILYAALGGESS